MLEVDLGQLPKLRFGQLLLVGEEARVDRTRGQGPQRREQWLPVTRADGPDDYGVPSLSLSRQNSYAYRSLLALRREFFCGALAQA